MLISGGINGTTSLNTAQLYDPTAGTWATAGNLNAARHGHTATLLADGKVLVAGGLNGTTTLATAAIYNPASGSGIVGGDDGPDPAHRPEEPHGGVAADAATSSSNNKVLLVGGNSGQRDDVGGLPVRPGAVGVQHAGSRCRARASGTR